MSDGIIIAIIQAVGHLAAAVFQFLARKGEKPTQQQAKRKRRRK